MSSMSLSWIAAQPRIDEPSMPKPSSNDDSENCSMGNDTWCHRPGRSVKRRSSSLAPFFFANSSTAFASALVSAIDGCLLVNTPTLQSSPAKGLAEIECFYALDKRLLSRRKRLGFSGIEGGKSG